jgi:hypothetical protein
MNWWLVSSVGLICDIVGVLLLFYYPPPEWTSSVVWRARLPPELEAKNERKEKLQPALSRVALWLIIVGFIFQLIGTAAPNLVTLAA